MSLGRGATTVLLLEVLVATCAAVLLLRVLLAGPIWLAVFYPAIWVYLPLAVLLVRRLPLGPYGFGTATWTGGWRLLLGSTVGVLLPFALAVITWKAAVGDLDLTFRHLTLAAVSSHLLFAALPEELFFRGYVQERLRSSCGAGAAIVLAAALFALAHLVVEPGWMRLAVFVPGLVMGWLRERSGGLLAPTLFHWLSNLTADVLAL